jgi:hypothetical protein
MGWLDEFSDKISSASADELTTRVSKNVADSGSQKSLPANSKSWLSDYAEPKTDSEYDVSEYADPKEETRMQRMKRLAKGAVDEGILSGAGGVMEAAANMATGAGASVYGGLKGLMMKDDAAAADAVTEAQKNYTYQPRTSSGKLIEELGSSAIAVPSEYLGKATGAIGGAVGGLVGGESGRMKGEAVGDEIGKIAIPFAMAAKAGRNLVNAAESPKIAIPPETRIQAQAIKSQAAGYAIPPSAASNTLWNRLITGYGGKLQTDQAASIKNQPTTNALVKRALGYDLGEDLSIEGLNALRKEAGKKYQAIKDTNEPIYSNDAYKSRLSDLTKDWNVAERDFPEIAKSKESIYELQRTMDKPYVTPTGAIEMVKHLRSEAKSNLKAFDDPSRSALGKAQRQAADALDGLVEDNLSANPLLAKAYPNAVKDYKDARQLIAKSYDVESALNDATGNVDALKLAKLLKDQRLTGHLKDVAEFAAAFKKNAQMPERIGTHPGISPLDVATSGIEATAALAAGRPGLAAGAVGTIAGRPLARMWGLSDAFQKGSGAAQKLDLSALKLAKKRAALMGTAVGGESADQQTGEQQ